MSHKPTILFLSTGDAVRSRIAEGFLRAFAGEHFDVMSAGVKPGALNPLASEVMKEKGIDISEQEPKSVLQLFKEHFAYVITVCDAAKERSPIFPFTPHLLHWSIADPAISEGSPEQRMEVFRRVRDEIENKIKQFIAETGQTNEGNLSIP